MNKMFLRIFAPLFLVFGLAWLPSASAQLYAKGAPPGSTFVRVLNGTANPSQAGFIGDSPQLPLPPYTAGMFAFMPPGPQVVQIGSLKETFQFAADRFYSVANTDNGLKVFELEGFKSQLKAMVVVLNLLPDTTVSLKTSDGKVAIIDGVVPYKAAQREINPLAITMALFKGDQKIADVPAVLLERGKASSLIVGGTAAVPVLTWDEQK